MIFSILESFGFVKKEKHPVSFAQEDSKAASSGEWLRRAICATIAQAERPQLDAERHCKYWTDSEQAEFEAEMNTMIHFMAFAHRRSIGAIRSRIRQQFDF